MTGNLVGCAPPFYVCDIDRVLDRYETIRTAFESQFAAVVIAYSYKTNYLPLLLRCLHEAGAWAEIVSPLEYDLAETLGVPAERIVFNGPSKGRDAIARAVRAGVLVHLDCAEEVLAAVECGGQAGVDASRVGLRVTLPIHDGAPRAWSRFGMDPEHIAWAATVLREAGFRVVSLHAHLSTKRRDCEAFVCVAEALCDAASRIGVEELEYVDVGGGMGFAPPTMGLSFPSFPEYAQIIAGTFRMRAPELMSRTIVLEPGISMVGDAFTFYAAVTAVKVVAGRTLVFVDGSVHNVKPTRHRHELPVCALDAFSMEPKTGATRACDVVGYTCMEDDFLAVDSQLPEVEVGDILRFDNVGAYTTVLKPPFIRGAPKVYVVEGGTFKEARRAENMEVFLGGYVT